MDLASVEHTGNTTSDPAETMHAGTTFEAAIRFADWCDQQRHLSAQRAMERFGLHKATAYRWINAYRAARGMA